MSNSRQFNYSSGSAFVREGYLYYSPNCQRHVVVDPPRYGNSVPFEVQHPNVSAFRQPVWWSEPWGWMSFIPLAPTFISYPFEPFSWTPNIVPIQVSLEGRSDLPARVVTKYQMTHDVIALWMQKQTLLVDAARQLRMNHSIAASPPPLPSSFGFDRAHKTMALAKQMVSLSRDWFGIWMGYLSFIIQQASILPSNRPTASSSPYPHWYQQLLDDSSHKWSLPWLDGLLSSPVCWFDRGVVRAGVVIPWSAEDRRRPSIDFFLERNIPLFFPWTSEAEKAISRNRDLEYLRPPRELIQQALTFILSAPQSAPLAALVIQRFCGVATEFRDPASVRVLKLQDSPSDVVHLVRKAFLKQHSSLTETEADDILNREMTAYHGRQEKEAAQDAMLPQQGMIPMEDPAQQKLYTDWKDFFRARAARRPAIIQGASDQLRQTYRNRKLQPPTKKTAMFTWEKVTTPGGLHVFVRKQAVRRQFDDLLDDEDPHVYDEVHNEWDIFPDFIIDTSSHPEPEEGVPRFCMAPPRQYVPYDPYSDDEDSDRETMYEEFSHAKPFNAVVSAPRPRSPSPLPRPLPTPAASSLSADSSGGDADRQESSRVQEDMDMDSQVLPRVEEDIDADCHEFTRVEENISLCTPITQALQYNYGFTHRIVESTDIPPNLKLLDEKRVGKVLGYLASSTPDQIDLSTKIFVSSLAHAQAPPPLLDDLHANNFTSLRDLFEFRNILRLRDGLFVFHGLSYPGHAWDIAVNSSEAAVYIVRYMVSNPTHNLVTVAHRLLKFGIPFHTVILRRTSLSSHQVATRHRYRLANYQFTAADFDSAMLAAKALLQGPAGRVALMRGGIIGRIARQFVSEDSVFEGPSEKVRREFCGYVVDSETRGHQYWDDILTDDDISVICGQYEVYTGHGSQTTFLSYFPLPREWDDKNGFCWLEWTDASEDLFQSILRKNQAGERPKNAGSWRKVVRGYGETRRLLEFNHARSMSFMHDVCHTRSYH